jgi:4-hydroxy-tetrahydrodipicolinate synthase
MEIYRWFLPLLHLDIGSKFVQNIKLAELLVRGTSPVVRQPRLALVGEEEAAIRAIVAKGLATRPDLGKYAALLG